MARRILAGIRPGRTHRALAPDLRAPEREIGSVPCLVASSLAHAGRGNRAATRRRARVSRAIRASGEVPFDPVEFLSPSGPAKLDPGITPGIASSFRDAYAGATCERLAAVKRRVDPSNLFRLNQNIRPA
jgi:hypothetical protein